MGSTILSLSDAAIYHPPSRSTKARLLQRTATARLQPGLHSGYTKRSYISDLQQGYAALPTSRVQYKCRATACLDGTELFRKHSKCPFAPKATAFPHQTTWNPAWSVTENMIPYKRALQDYVAHIEQCQRTQTKCHDFFSIEAPAALYGQNSTDFHQWTYDVLMCINAEAMAQLHQIMPDPNGNYIDTDWRLMVGAIRFFVLTTSSLYDKTSSRYTGGPEMQKQVLLHLQPSQSFDWWLPKQPAQRLQVKQAIRKTFDKANRPYEHLHLTPDQQHLHHAMKFVFPLEKESKQTPWWHKLHP